jgi:hypothetical protein
LGIQSDGDVKVENPIRLHNVALKLNAGKALPTICVGAVKLRFCLSMASFIIYNASCPQNCERRLTISFVMSVLSIRTERLGSRWAAFDET